METDRHSHLAVSKKPLNKGFLPWPMPAADRAHPENNISG
jgi:hypothetical protein